MGQQTANLAWSKASAAPASSLHRAGEPGGLNRLFELVAQQQPGLSQEQVREVCRVIGERPHRTVILSARSDGQAGWLLQRARHATQDAPQPPCCFPCCCRRAAESISLEDLGVDAALGQVRRLAAATLAAATFVA